MNKKPILIALLLVFGFQVVHAQIDSTATRTDSTAPKKMSGFDKFNVKMERLFKIIPVPIISYSTEAGNTFGLAKNNIINISKKDTISKPSRLSEVITFSTKGRINFSVATELIFKENKYIILAYFNYRKQP